VDATESHNTTYVVTDDQLKNSSQGPEQCTEKSSRAVEKSRTKADKARKIK